MPRPPASPRCRRAPTTASLVRFALVVVLSSLLAGCGVQADHTAGAADGDGEASLPTLPPVEERSPDAYDADGCLILSEGRDCGATAGAVDDALAGDESARTLRGFQGPLFVTDLAADVVTVLEETVATTTSGPWTASGLLRNETTSPVVAPVVTATLRGADGAVLGEVAGTVPVAPVRPGEPAPFTIQGEVDAASVEAVEWRVVDAGGEPPPGTRDLELTTYFAEPAGQREPLGLYLYDESGPGPHPYVLYGSIANLADIDATHPAVVAAWLDDDGRVRAIAEGGAVEPDGRPTQQLAPAALSDFLITVTDGADGLDGATLLLWAVSR